MIFITTYNKYPAFNPQEFFFGIRRDDVPVQRFGQSEREACLRYSTLPAQKEQMDQVVGAVSVPASVDVSASYVALLSVLALPSWLLSNNEQSVKIQKVKRNFPLPLLLPGNPNPHRDLPNWA
jgi:hypothetical protein